MLQSQFLRNALVVATVLALASSACTKGKPGEPKALSDVAESGDTRQGSAKVLVLAAGVNPDGTYRGEGYDTKVSVENDKEDERLRVEFVEGEVGRSGDMWRASGWQASTVGVLTTGIKPSNRKITFDVKGDLGDGPSAGALLTVGLISVLRGDKLDGDMTMTGMINPDGTVGPVGGIPGKLDAAKRHGKKRILIPIGQRTETNPVTEETIDLVDYGEELGLKVEEVGDIYSAYQQFTGKKLPRWGTETDDVDLEADVADRFKTKAKEWYGRYEKSRAEFGTLDPLIQEVFADQMAGADAVAARSDKHLGEGLIAGALTEATEAAVLAHVAYQQGQFTNLYTTQGFDAVVSQLKAAATSTSKIDAVVEEFEAFKPKTVAQAGAVIDGYSWIARAVVFSDQGNSSIADAEAATTEDEQLAAVGQATLYFGLADLIADLAGDLMDIEKDLKGPELPKEIDLETIADFFRRAADANYNAFLTGFVQAFAEQEGVSEDVMLNALTRADFDVLVAAHSSVIGSVFKEVLKDGKAAQYGQLGAALNLYSESSQLLASYIALGAIVDEEENVVGFERDKALTNELDFAEGQVERAIGALRDNKVDPSVPVSLYEVARSGRDTGPPADKITALGDLWRAYVTSRLLSYLGNFPSVDSGVS